MQECRNENFPGLHPVMNQWIRALCLHHNLEWNTRAPLHILMGVLVLTPPPLVMWSHLPQFILPNHVKATLAFCMLQEPFHFHSVWLACSILKTPGPPSDLGGVSGSNSGQKCWVLHLQYHWCHSQAHWVLCFCVKFGICAKQFCAQATVLSTPGSQLVSQLGVL